LGASFLVLLLRQDESSPPPPPPPSGTPDIPQPLAVVVAYIGEDGNLYVKSEAEDATKLTNDGGIVHPSWSPDGRRIAYIHVIEDASQEPPTTELMVVSSNGGNPLTAAEAGFYESGGEEHRTVLRNPRWSPDGSAIYYLEDHGEHESYLNRLVLESDLASAKVEENLVDPAVLFGEGVYLESFDVHPSDGTIVYQACRREDPDACGLGLQTPPGVVARAAVLLAIHQGAYYGFPAWSLDGSKIGLYAYTEGAPRIAVVDAAGGDLHDLNYTDVTPDQVKDRFWPTLAPLPDGGFAYENGDDISISAWGGSGTTLPGHHPALYPGSEFQRAAVPWAGPEQLDCANLWTGEYFANDSLDGAPTMVRCDKEIDFDWGEEGSPWPSIPADKFSVRWTGQIYIPEPGDYTVKTFTDDGVRLQIDGAQVIDEWRPQQEEHKKDLTLAAGGHSVEMEFYDGARHAIARLSWAQVEPTPTPTPPPTPSPTPSATPRRPVTPSPTPSTGALPDLIITKLAWEPATLRKADTVTKWCVTIENRGADFTTNAGPYIALKVDGKELFEPSQWQVAELGSGESRKVCTSEGLRSFGIGSHTVNATVDPGDQVEEIDEKNNTFTKGLIVGPPR
jgi:hypothetical protein